MAASLVVWIAAFGPAAAWAGPYSRLQVLVPGESPAPGTTTGKTGTPNRQTANVPFTVTVRACDSGWNLVPATTNAIEIQASDASATLPAPAQLVAGTATFQVTFNAGGNFTILAHDQTDGTIPDGVSSVIQTLVLQGFQFATISQKHKYAGVPDGTTITAIDPNGATVSGFSGQVHLREITSFGDGRITPEYVTFSNGQWSGNVTMYRADESSINRGNVNMYAFLDAAPQKNGTSDPFIVHPGPPARVQLVVPGESPLPGSISGKVGSPATQGAGRAFVVSVWATDAYWNPVPSAANVRLTSTDANDNMPLTGVLTNGFRQFSPILGTVGTQTLTIADVAGSLQGMTSPGIQVIPSDVDHFVVSTIASPQIAGVPVAVTIRATDSNGNTIPAYAGDAVLVANTGAGSISPEFVSFTAGIWTGPMTFRGAGGAVSFAVADFSAPPHIGSSNTFTVNPGPFSGVQVLLPGQSPRGGTPDGKEGNPTPQQAGTAFSLTVRAVDDYWNLVNTVADSIALGSTDAFAGMPAHTKFTGGQALLPATLYRTGLQRIWASDITTVGIRPDTSSAVLVSGGPFARLLVLAPGEYPAPGLPGGRAGTATDQSINYAFNVTVLATDNWWNPVGGVTDMVRITSDDPDAELPPDQALVDGQAEMSIRLKRGGYNQITVSDVTNPGIPGSSTQVSAISSGFHLQATITPTTARAGESFTLTVKAVNAAGSVIREINSAVRLEVWNATNTSVRGRGLLNPTAFQLNQGQRSVSATYTFVEPIIIKAYDDAGNDPATSNSITITPGLPDSIKLDAPTWVGGNTRTRLTATLMDEFGNGVPGEEMVFSVLTGSGTLTRLDSLTVGDGSSRADYQSPRFPEMGSIRASSAGVVSNWNIETAFVDPNAKGGHVTNYPNPFHPPDEPTTIAYKLSDQATVKMRIFTLSGDLVLARTYERGAPGGLSGLNEVTWDGRNGEDRVVASGGYIVLIEAQGIGQTLHVIRRKIAVVR